MAIYLQFVKYLGTLQIQWISSTQVGMILSSFGKALHRMLGQTSIVQIEMEKEGWTGLDGGECYSLGIPPFPHHQGSCTNGKTKRSNI
jgi:hypothetical protein